MAKAKKEPHRPTKYRAEYARIAHQMTLNGATDERLALAFDVSESTLNLWKQKHPRFSESIRKGKAHADAEIANALFHSARGYQHPAVKIFNTEAGVIEHRYTEFYPPNPTSITFWLRNRCPDIWRDKPEVQVNVNNDVNVDLNKPPEEWGQNEILAELNRRNAVPVPPKVKG